MKRPMTQGGRIKTFAIQKCRVLCTGRNVAGTVIIQKIMAERRSLEVVPELVGRVFSTSYHCGPTALVSHTS